MTTTVHYLRFDLTPGQVERFGAGPVQLAITHPDYDEAAELTPEARAELLRDLLE